MSSVNYSKPGFGKFSVRYAVGRGFAVVSPGGVIIGSYLPTESGAEAACTAMQQSHDERVKRGPRRCMTCGDEFHSQGIHNRMCGGCRLRSTGDESTPFGFGAIHGRKRA